MDWNKKQTMIPALVMLALAILTIAAGFWLGKAPSPVEVDAAPTVFSAQRAFIHLEQIGAAPTPLGSEQHEKARMYIVDVLQDLGYEPAIQQAFVYNPNWRNAGEVFNVLVRIPGTEPTKALVIAAHYDTVAGVPGAGNGKSGVAALLEMARLLTQVPPGQNDIILLFSDGKEEGSLGATAFLQQHPWAEDAGLYINLGARGTSGPVLLTETTPRNSRLIQEFGSAVANPMASSAVNEIYRWVINDTDFLVFKQTGLPGLNLIFNEDSRHFQTVLDNPDNLDPGSLQHLGAYLSSLVEHFGSQDLNAAFAQEDTAPLDRVYFDIWGKAFVHYPLTWVAHLLTFLLILVGFACWYAVKKEESSIKGLAMGFVILLVVGFVSTILSSLFAGLTKPSHALYQYIPQYNGLWYFAALTAFILGLFTLVYNWALNKFKALDLILGAEILLLLVTIFVSLLFPGASYLLIWPMIFGLAAIGAMVVGEKLPWYAQVAILYLGGLPIFLLWPTMFKTFYTIIGFGLTELLVFLYVLILGLLLPQIRLIFSWDRRALPILALVVFLACLGVIIPGAKITGTNPHMDSLFVHVDLNHDKAYWASIDRQPDEYTRQALGDEYGEGNLSDFIPYEDMPIISREIPWEMVQDILSEPVGVSLLRDEITDQSRELTIQIRALQPVDNIIVFIEPEQLVADVVLNGEHILEWDEQWPVLRYYSLPAEGITLTVPTIMGQTFSLTVLAQQNGLPHQLQQGLSPRPESIIPAPTGVTDNTFSIKTYHW